MLTQSEVLAKMNTAGDRMQALVDIFNTKENDIEIALAAAVAAAPNLNKVFFVDAIDGDDEIGLGTEAVPFQSLKKAVDSVPNNGSGLIRLLKNQQHDISDDVNYGYKNIYIVPAAPILSDAEKPEIVCHAYESAGYNKIYGFSAGNSLGNIQCTSCKLTIDDTNYNNGIPNSIHYTAINSSAYATGSSFYFNGLICDLGETGASLINCNNGIAIVTIFSSDFIATSGNIIDCGTSGLALVSVNTSTKDAGANWYSNPALVLSNV